jgi:hypothetical protein
MSTHFMDECFVLSADEWNFAIIFHFRRRFVEESIYGVQ